MLPKKVRDDYKAAVKRGAAKLDKKIHKWLTKIDIKLLDLGNAEKCMIGQLKGGFTTDTILSAVNGMYKNLDDNERDDEATKLSITHGFYCRDYAENSNEDYSFLTELWRNLIIERWLKMPKAEAKKLLVAALAKDEDVC